MSEVTLSALSSDWEAKGPGPENLIPASGIRPECRSATMVEEGEESTLRFSSVPSWSERDNGSLER